MKLQSDREEPLCSTRGGWRSLRLTLHVLEELLLLGDEVLLLGVVRLQLADSVLRHLQFLTLNQQALPQHLHLLPIRRLQHLGLLGGGDGGRPQSRK